MRFKAAFLVVLTTFSTVCGVTAGAAPSANSPAGAEAATEAGTERLVDLRTGFLKPGNMRNPFSWGLSSSFTVLAEMPLLRSEGHEETFRIFNFRVNRARIPAPRAVFFENEMCRVSVETGAFMADTLEAGERWLLRRANADREHVYLVVESAFARPSQLLITCRLSPQSRVDDLEAALGGRFKIAR